MALLRLLKKITNEFHKNEYLKFIIVGGINTSISYLIFIICASFFSIHYLISITISYAIGIICSLILNYHWTFSNQKKKLDFIVIFKFLLIYIINFLLNILILLLLVKLQFNAVIAQGIALALTTIISFIGQKYWAFKLEKVENIK